MFRLLSVFLLMTTLSGCLDLVGDSVNSLITDKANIVHTKKAMLFLKEGGATESDSYQVSIVGYHEQFDTLAVGNTFIVDSDHGKAWLNPKCIELKWLANDTLAITYDSKLRTFLQNKTVGSVTVIYQQK